jgi:hypothetical protein
MAGAGGPDEVRRVIDATLEAQNAGDAARLSSMLSERPDGVHIGTDAGEWETTSRSWMPWPPPAAGTTSTR